MTTHETDQELITKGLSNISDKLSKITEALYVIRNNEAEEIEAELRNLYDSATNKQNGTASDLLKEYFDTDVINFIANIDDLIDEVALASKENNDYLDVFKQLEIN
ncbi:hypothetical protein [Leuconostoc citreum]|uniref:hypothetical protein n=1 Tax=Leuconostoc citreum TaxID=33964 RepID=UPI0032DE5E59